MSKKNFDGKTYYYLLDENKVLHTCSDGFTVCGLETVGFSEATDKTIEFKVCEACETVNKIKKATFETKAELIEEPESVRGRII